MSTRDDHEILHCEICAKRYVEDPEGLPHLDQPPFWAVREVYEAEELSGLPAVCNRCCEDKIHPAAWELAEEEEAESAAELDLADAG